MNDAAPAYSLQHPAHDRFASDRFVVLAKPFPNVTDQLRTAISALDARASSILAQCAYRTEVIAELAKTNRQELIVVPEQNAPQVVCRYEYILGASDAVRTLETLYIRPLVATVVGRPLSILKDKMNRKSAGGGAFAPHQDHEAYQKFPPTWYVTAMVAIDEATEANGCLEVALNFDQVVRDHPECVASWIANNPLLRAHEGGPNNGEILDETSSRLDWRAVPVEAGDILIFDSYIPHRSARNQSQESRRALFFTYNIAESGDWYDYYYQTKRARYDDPMFHVGTPTVHGTQ